MLKVSGSEQVIQVVLMPSIKIYPPAQLPDRNISETQFNIWKEEIEVYISQEKDFKIFLPGQAYANWESAEAYGNRIRQLHDNDVVIADRDTTAAQAAIENEEKLSDLRIHLRTVLAIMCIGRTLQFRNQTLHFTHMDLRNATS